MYLVKLYLHLFLLDCITLDCYYQYKAQSKIASPIASLFSIIEEARFATLTEYSHSKRPSSNHRCPQGKFEEQNIKAPRRKFMFPNVKFGHSLFGLSLLVLCSSAKWPNRTAMRALYLLAWWKIYTYKKSAKHNTELNKHNREPSMAILDLLFIFVRLTTQWQEMKY